MILNFDMITRLRYAVVIVAAAGTRRLAENSGLLRAVCKECRVICHEPSVQVTPTKSSIDKIKRHLRLIILFCFSGRAASR